MAKKKIQANTDKSNLSESQENIGLVYNPSREVKKRLYQLQERIKIMKQRKRDLKIDEKCDRMDALFTPHLTSIEPTVEQESIDFDKRRALLGLSEAETARKSKPLAFRKITTAQSKLIRENIKVKARAHKEKYKNLNLLAIKTYEENWSSNKLTPVLRSLIKDLALYGICYGRRFLKRVWRLRHKEDGELEKVYWINSIIIEKLNPRDVLLDDSCTHPNNAKDGAIIKYYDQDDFDARFPQDTFPDAKYVKTGQTRYIEVDENGQERIKTKTGNRRDKIQVTYYQNVLKDAEEIIGNGVYLDKKPLIGGVLSIIGAKWVVDKEDYDAIGIGQIIELYQPLIDDILNASNERLRQIVRPVKIEGNDVKLADDSDEEWKSGATLKYDGDVSQIKWDRPPAATAAEIEEIRMLMEEVDIDSMVPRALEGQDLSETAFQAAQNREEALSVLSLPLDNIKEMLDDDANKFFRIAKDVYSEPEEVEMLIPRTSEYNEALDILAINPNDERFVKMSPDEEYSEGGVARRKFHQIEVNLAKELKEENGELIDTGKIIETEEREFWEMIPEHFNWEGALEIIPMSFLPTSEAIQNQQKKERAEFLMQIPTINEETGQPTLLDATGKPHTINKVRVIKDYVEGTKEDPDKYVIPMNISSGNINKKTPTPSEITEKELAGLAKPEQRVREKEFSKTTQLPKM